MNKEKLKKEINKNIKIFFNDKGKNGFKKSALPKVNGLLLDWAKLNNKSFVDGCKDFNLYINPNLGDIQKLPIL